MIARAFDNAILGGECLSWKDAFVLGSLSLFILVPGLAALYIVKSALGINLMDGPSPLHDLLYSFAV